MAKIPEPLRQIYKQNPDVSLIMDKFFEIDKVYQQTLEAMGVSNKPSIQVRNSADITASFKKTPVR